MSEMRAPGFVFPPPPPPPPAAQNYPTYPTNTQHNGYGGRGNRGGRDSDGRAASNSRRGSRGSSAGSTGGYSRSEGCSSSWNDGYSVAGGYPLPEYPSVPRSQYPPNLHHGYGHTPSLYPPAVATPYPVQPAYPNHQQRPPSYYNGASQGAPYTSHPPTQSAPYPPSEGWDHSARDHSHGNQRGQPALMGPPIRLGFDGGYTAENYQSPLLAQTYQVSAEDRRNPFHSDSQEGNRQSYRHDSPSNLYPARHEFPNTFQGQRNRGQKRGYSDAFGGSKRNNPKFQTAPAVPSFGIPLPTKPPAPQETGRKRKKKRRHNQLGLTPKTEEHESSEEEDDIDEETKLAAAVNPGLEQQQLQFTYKGRTATLQSSAEIAAFIQERKKRFPTKERREEAAKLKRDKQEAQRAADQARKKVLEKQKAEFRTKQNAEAREAKENKIKKAEKEQVERGSESTVSKAKSKMEKLRRKLEKEEKRFAKAEAKAFKVKPKDNKDDQASLQSHADSERIGADNGIYTNGTSVDGTSQVKIESVTPTETKAPSPLKEGDASKIKVGLEEVPRTTTAADVVEDKTIETQNVVPDPLTPTSQPSLPEEDLIQINAQLPSTTSKFPTSTNPSLKSPSTHPVPEAIDRAGASSPSTLTTTSDDSDLSISTGSDSEDFTSSSGSSSGDDVPETAPATRTAPDRVPPPKKVKPKAICRNFLQSGHCKRGDACSFRHELPERGSQAVNKKREDRKAKVKTERKGLYQRLVEQEKEKEDLDVLAAIVHLGEKGMLQEQVPEDNDAQVKKFGAAAGDKDIEAAV